jgi:hypothetical protein
MGLDNGFVIKAKTERAKEFMEGNFYSFKVDWYDTDSDYEFGYFRKCWNIRDGLRSYVFKDRFKDNGYTYFTIEDIPEIIAGLKYFLDEDNWDNDESIWEWYVALNRISDAIYRLYRFYDIKKELEAYGEWDLSDDDFEMYFYDSY